MRIPKSSEISIASTVIATFVFICWLLGRRSIEMENRKGQEPFAVEEISVLYLEQWSLNFHFRSRQHTPYLFVW